jgi:hypothetical protein
MIPAMSRNNPISLETLTCDHVARWIRRYCRQQKGHMHQANQKKAIPTSHPATPQCILMAKLGIAQTAEYDLVPAPPIIQHTQGYTLGRFPTFTTYRPLGHHRRQAFPATPSWHRKNEAVVVCQWISRCHCRGARSPRSSCRLSIEVRLAPLSPLPYHRYEMPA